MKSIRNEHEGHDHIDHKRHKLGHVAPSQRIGKWGKARKTITFRVGADDQWHGMHSQSSSTTRPHRSSTTQIRSSRTVPTGPKDADKQGKPLLSWLALMTSGMKCIPNDHEGHDHIDHQRHKLGHVAPSKQNEQRGQPMKISTIRVDADDQ